jgi:hypothetical protein
MAAPTTYASFLVRLWRQELPELPRENAGCQGEVEHIQGGRLDRFDTLDELLDILRQQADNLEVQSLPADERPPALCQGEDQVNSQRS